MSEPERRYILVTSDRYDADLEKFFLHVNSILGPAYAGKWLDGLTLTVKDLAGFPGPLSHAVDEEASAVLGREARRVLYYGPTRRRTGTPARILFTLLPPDPTESLESAETVIFLLRLLHGAQTLLPPDAAD